MARTAKGTNLKPLQNSMNPIQNHAPDGLVSGPLGSSARPITPGSDMGSLAVTGHDPAESARNKKTAFDGPGIHPSIRGNVGLGGTKTGGRPGSGKSVY